MENQSRNFPSHHWNTRRSKIKYKYTYLEKIGIDEEVSADMLQMVVILGSG